jgi:hypothetical protein
MIEERVSSTRSIGFFSIVSIFMLFAVLLATGALYFYKIIVTKNIEKMKEELIIARNRFEPARITELQVLDRRLSSSKEILSKHIAITPIFQALQDITMKTVRYTKFGYILGEDPQHSRITIKMNGTAIGYRSVALQSDLFTENKNLIDPVFSNLTLDDKGNVNFDLEFSVDPSFVDYKTMLKTMTAPAPVVESEIIL